MFTNLFTVILHISPRFLCCFKADVDLRPKLSQGVKNGSAHGNVGFLVNLETTYKNDALCVYSPPQRKNHITSENQYSWDFWFFLVGVGGNPF